MTRPLPETKNLRYKLECLFCLGSIFAAFGTLLGAIFLLPRIVVCPEGFIPIREGNSPDYQERTLEARPTCINITFLVPGPLQDGTYAYPTFHIGKTMLILSVIYWIVLFLLLKYKIILQ
jgi:hypothetical protein